MAVAGFEELCRGVCELVGCEAPSLARDAEGRAAMRVVIQGVEATLTHEPQRSATHAFVLASFGPLLAGAELDACKALLELNAELLRHGGACFSRHPVSGEALLQYAYSLAEATPVDLFRRVGELAGIVQSWQRRVNF